MKIAYYGRNKQDVPYTYSNLLIGWDDADVLTPSPRAAPTTNI